MASKIPHGIPRRPSEGSHWRGSGGLCLQTMPQLRVSILEEAWWRQTQWFRQHDRFRM